MKRFFGNKSFLFLAIIALLVLTFFVSSFFLYSQQRKQHINSGLEQVSTETDLIGAILTDAMLRRDYSEGLQLLADWPRNHGEVTLLEAVLDNGQIFFEFREPGYRADDFETSRVFEYGDRHLTIRLAHDSAGARKALSSLVNNMFLLSTLLIILIGGALWYVLFQWMIKPMEEEIAARRRSEAQSRKLSRAVEQSSNMIFITDKNGTIEYVNPKFTELTGYTPEEAQGQTPRLIKSNETPHTVYEELWTTLLSGQEWRGEMKDRRKDGRIFWAAAVITPVRDHTGAITHFVAMHEDITHRKLAEEKIAQALTEAKVANRAKSEILANMSHELRTPLNAIIGFSNTIQNEIFGPLGNSKYSEYAGDILFSGEHLLELINDILDVSAIEAGKVELQEENLDINELVETSLRLVRGRAEQGRVTLVKDVPATSPIVYGDGRRLKQVFINLLTNAIKFTPEQGIVTLTVVVDEQGGLRCSVSDTGVGMDADELVIARTQFGQADSGLNRKHEGTGLGLPLAEGLVELHGGKLDIVSEKGKGTTASVILPPERLVLSN